MNTNAATGTLSAEQIQALKVKIAEAKQQASNITCTVCCAGVLVTFAICAHITAFAGLSHTQRVDLDPLCPPGYWDSSISLLFIRFAVYCLVACSMCCSEQIKECGCLICIVMLAQVTILSVAISDSVVTSQALSALNCSATLRADRDNEPLLIVSGSMFIAIDWLLCLCACCACCCRCREREAVADMAEPTNAVAM